MYSFSQDENEHTLTFLFFPIPLLSIAKGYENLWGTKKNIAPSENQPIHYKSLAS